MIRYIIDKNEADEIEISGLANDVFEETACLLMVVAFVYGKNKEAAVQIIKCLQKDTCKFFENLTDEQYEEYRKGVDSN